MSYLWPSDDQFAGFQSAFDDAEKVVMLNLLRFKTHADYSDFPDETPCSGREAFTRYEKAVVPMIESRGGRVVFYANAKNTVIGPPHENWDLMILVEYPNARALGAMTTSDAYQAVAHHRSAATEDSRLIPLQAAAK